MIRSFYAVAARDAAAQLWGPGCFEDIAARMAPRERDELFAERLDAWFPERALIAACFAVWEGIADRDRERYSAWIDAMMDLSFGRIKRLFLSMATPDKLFTMAPKLWREGHTHGELVGILHGPGRGTLILRDHPYTETPQARATISESMRHIVSLTRAKSVSESHALVEAGALEMKIRWG